MGAENGGGGAVRITGEKAQNEGEKFRIVRCAGFSNEAGGDVAIQSRNGKYLCAENGGGGKIAANRSALGAWETFKMQILEAPAPPRTRPVAAAVAASPAPPPPYGSHVTSTPPPQYGSHQQHQQQRRQSGSYQQPVGGPPAGPPPGARRQSSGALPYGTTSHPHTPVMSRGSFSEQSPPMYISPQAGGPPPGAPPADTMSSRAATSPYQPGQVAAKPQS